MKRNIRHKTQVGLSQNCIVEEVVADRAFRPCIGWPKKVSHCQKSALNRIKYRQWS